MFKQLTVKHSRNDSQSKKKVRLRRGDTISVEPDQLKRSKGSKLENRYIDLSNNVLNKSLKTSSFEKEKENLFIKDLNTDTSSLETSIRSPKNLNEYQTVSESASQIQIIELQNKIKSLHLLDIKTQAVSQKADELIKKSEEARKNMLVSQFNFEDNFQNQSEDEGPEGMYFGQFKKGAPQGRGILKINDSMVFEGRWHKGKYHGEGKQTNINYNVTNEIYYISKFQSKLEKGLIQIQNWKYYKGIFEDGKKHGQGVLVISGDYQVHGQFNKNSLLGEVKLFNKYNTLVLTQTLIRPILIKQ